MQEKQPEPKTGAETDGTEHQKLPRRKWIAGLVLLAVVLAAPVTWLAYCRHTENQLKSLEEHPGFQKGPCFPVWFRRFANRLNLPVPKRILKDMGVNTLFVEPASPWENGYAESFNSRMRDELLDGELFLHLDEMKYVVERWRMDYNHYRPHSSLGYMTPAGSAELCREAGCIRPNTPVLDGVQECGILS